MNPRLSSALLTFINCQLDCWEMEHKEVDLRGKWLHTFKRGVLLGDE